MSHSATPFWKRWSLLKQHAGAPATSEPPSSAGLAPEFPDLDTLRALFRQPEFSVRDGLDDYDGDYTFFEPRGELLTCDMRWVSERTRPTATGAPEPALTAQAESCPDQLPPSESAG